MPDWRQPVVMYQRLKARMRGRPEHFLARVPGVIHVGANAGQERRRYNKYGLHVVWVEPIPEVFATLQANVGDHPKHRAFQRLITDQTGQEYTFHVASNAGESSSILPLKDHQTLWPEIGYERELLLTSTTLDDLCAAEGIDLDLYGALILDTQGSELLVLQGARGVLSRFTYVKAEAADFEAYENNATIEQLTAFMAEQGFSEMARHEFAAKPDGTGRYYDVVFINNAAR
ncbi:MAG: FkbM family methyltransferase [Planctomycetota bacterium]